jgi:hypothetical protein
MAWRISPIGVEYCVDREVHTTAGQEASATSSCSEPQPEAKQEIFSISTGIMLWLSARSPPYRILWIFRIRINRLVYPRKTEFCAKFGPHNLYKHATHQQEPDSLCAAATAPSLETYSQHRMPGPTVGPRKSYWAVTVNPIADEDKTV